MGLFDVFKKKKQPNIVSDRQILMVGCFRRIAKVNNISLSNISNDKIYEIYNQVLKRFREASDIKNDFILAESINAITFDFLYTYQLKGEIVYYERLESEII